jgi:hypothetical protein
VCALSLSLSLYKYICVCLFSSFRNWSTYVMYIYRPSMRCYNKEPLVSLYC